ncbi:MAG: type II secretion system protein M [Deltaproteobacteria bacterium]|nr:type II secretion system protein M [Deltaproteobacteria bacterium]
MFRKIRDRVRTWWENISPREKKIVLAMGGAVVALVFVATIYLVSARLSDAEARIAEKEAKLNEIIQLRSAYKEAERVTDVVANRLKNNNVNLFSHIEDLARRMDVEVSDMNERTAAAEKDAKVKEVSVEVNINKITQDRLLDFLDKLEHGAELVKITKFRFRARFDKDKQKLIDANVTISTYKAAG